MPTTQIKFNLECINFINRKTPDSVGKETNCQRQLAISLSLWSQRFRETTDRSTVNAGQRRSRPVSTFIGNLIREAGVASTGELSACMNINRADWAARPLVWLRPPE